jgi:hypothetical protein
VLTSISRGPRDRRGPRRNPETSRGWRRRGRSASPAGTRTLIPHCAALRQLLNSLPDHSCPQLPQGRFGDGEDEVLAGDEAAEDAAGGAGGEGAGDLTDRAGGCASGAPIGCGPAGGPIGRSGTIARGRRRAWPRDPGDGGYLREADEPPAASSGAVRLTTAASRSAPVRRAAHKAKFIAPPVRPDSRVPAVTQSAADRNVALTCSSEDLAGSRGSGGTFAIKALRPHHTVGSR